MSSRLFTVEEANALVPRLALAMQRIQQTAMELQRAAQAYATAQGRATAEVSPNELARAQPAVRGLIETLDGTIEEIQNLGIEVKDLRLGLCDFPAEFQGEVVYLCWQTGETEVGYWHPTDEGFAGRQPIPGVTRSTPVQ